MLLSLNGRATLPEVNHGHALCVLSLLSTMSLAVTTRLLSLLSTMSLLHVPHLAFGRSTIMIP